MTSIYTIFESVRRVAMESGVRYLGEPHGGLVIGIILGLKDFLPQQFYQDLIITGTIHIVVASGSNIALIHKMVNFVTEKRLPIVFGLIASILSIWGYALLIGASPPIVRACVMFSFAILARFCGREYRPTTALIQTILIMLSINTSYLESLSFWLSVAATWGITSILPHFESGFSSIENRLLQSGMITHQRKNITRVPTLIKIRDFAMADLSSSLATFLATLPLIGLTLGTVSLKGIVVNPMILWLVPIIMVLGGLKIVIGLFSDLFAYVMGIYIWFPLEVFKRLIAIGLLIPLPVFDFSDRVESLNRYHQVIAIFLCYLILFVSTNRVKKWLKSSK